MSALATLLLMALVPSEPGSVVVLPPDPATPPSESAWVAEAVADLLPRDLDLLGVSVVQRDDRLRAQEALAIPQAPLTRATSIRIAAVLGAARLVVGSYETQGQALTLSLRLLDVERGTLSAPFRASGPVETAADLIHTLAFDLALAGPTRPAHSREEFLKDRATPAFEAVRAYGQGLAAPDTAGRVRLLKRALQLAPGFDEARLALGRLYLQAREHASAYETLAHVPATSPLARAARFLQGVALLERGRHRDAAALYATLARHDPTPAALNNHALALLRLGAASPEGVKASDVLRKAVELAPGSRDLPFNLGWALLVEGDAEAAAFWLRGATRQLPADSNARLALVWALRQAGRADQADEEWKRLMAVAPSYESLAAPEPARRFERIAPSERLLIVDDEGRSDAELAAVHIGRAEKLTQAGDREAALRELTQAVLLDPYGARGHHLLARANLAGGEREKAVNELRVSLWCQDQPAIRLELAALLKDMGRVGEARAEAEKVLKLEPGSQAARRLLEKQ